jgi:leader peptidase (prepilin peptidase) / N-methyltransferase
MGAPDPSLLSPEVAVAAALVLGLVVGSFLNVVIHRLPKMMELEWEAQAAEIAGHEPPAHEPYNLVRPRSQCPACGHQIRAIENIPVVSWLVQRGRCTACSAPISTRYPIVELATAALSAVAIWKFGATAAGAGAMVFAWAMVLLAFIDADTQLLPDDITMPLLWAGLALNLGGVYVPIDTAVVGAMAGYLSLWAVYWLFKLIARKEGMGYGDFKLLAAIGAWLGWQALPAVIVLSSVVGAAIGIVLIVLRNRGREVPIPFGPYLAGAGLLAMYLRGPIAECFPF